jgi:hypothetical protein
VGVALLVLASVLLAALALALSGCGPNVPPVTVPTLAGVRIVTGKPVPR